MFYFDGRLLSCLDFFNVIHFLLFYPMDYILQPLNNFTIRGWEKKNALLWMSAFSELDSHSPLCRPKLNGYYCVPVLSIIRKESGEEHRSVTQLTRHRMILAKRTDKGVTRLLQQQWMATDIQCWLPTPSCSDDIDGAKHKDPSTTLYCLWCNNQNPSPNHTKASWMSFMNQLLLWKGEKMLEC